MKKSIFIAATGQNVGKTTLCLGIMAGLQKRFGSVGFIKPVGQQHIRVVDAIDVDKDVFLFKNYFNLHDHWEDMSPIMIPAGMTRGFLDGKYNAKEMLSKIQVSFAKIAANYQHIVVEGTGHVAVGSIMHLNNATVASALDLEMLIIASGGLGSAFDELELNVALCREKNIPIRGIILNRVLPNKREMLQDYFPKALKRWNIPLIGAIPYSEYLSQPTMRDFGNLFNVELLAGESKAYRNFCHTRLVASSLEVYKMGMIPNELVITPACREEIILANIAKHGQVAENENSDFSGGLILTGYRLPNPYLVEKIKEMDIPALYVPLQSYDVMTMINSFTSKIRQGDSLKIEKAIALVEKNIDFDLL